MGKPTLAVTLVVVIIGWPAGSAAFSQPSSFLDQEPSTNGSSEHGSFKVLVGEGANGEARLNGQVPLARKNSSPEKGPTAVRLPEMEIVADSHLVCTENACTQPCETVNALENGLGCCSTKFLICNDICNSLFCGLYYFSCDPETCSSRCLCFKCPT